MMNSVDDKQIQRFYNEINSDITLEEFRKILAENDDDQIRKLFFDKRCSSSPRITKVTNAELRVLRGSGAGELGKKLSAVTTPQQKDFWNGAEDLWVHCMEKLINDGLPYDKARKVANQAVLANLQILAAEQRNGRRCLQPSDSFEI